MAGKKLDEQMEKFVREHSDTKLIIVDTLQKPAFQVDVHQIEHRAASGADEVRVGAGVAVEPFESSDRADRDHQTLVLEHG